MITDWPTIRAQFPVLKEWVYLNSATFGPVPTCAVEAAANHFRRRDQQACLDFLDWYTDADAVRAQAAELIGAEPDDVGFIPNAATALSWVVNGIRWTPGDHVVTLPHEFPNNEYFARVLEQRGVPPRGRYLPLHRGVWADITAIFSRRSCTHAGLRRAGGGVTWGPVV